MLVDSTIASSASPIVGRAAFRAEIRDESRQRI
jgi:hypothetical protein